MAQSLQCNDCGTLLRSVKEAQDHADATGHTNFAESTAALKRLVCTECGKVCRSEVEQDLHSKRTGHKSFEDKTGEEAPIINTEVEMAEARAELNGDEDKPKEESSEPVEMVPPEVNAEFLDQMLQMGFAKNRSIRALHFSGNAGVDPAVTWLADHDEDADIDEDLLVPREAPKVKLSAEEAKAKAAELLRKAKERREQEERERERLREVERVRMGKEMAAMAKLEEDQRLKRIAEERKREKEEEERAREKIKRKLEEDRRERRIRLGLPAELTEEEKEEEARKEREKAAEEAKRKLPVKPVIAAEKMRDILVDMKKSQAGQDDKLKTAWQTLFKLIGNVANNPSEEKFRRIKLTNPAIQQRVVSVKGSVDFLEECGFEHDSDGESLVLPEGKVNVLLLQAAGEQLHSAMNNPFFGML